jgi:hypothetical protein
MVRTYVAVASALALASCADANRPAFCAGPVMPAPLATAQSRPLGLSMGGKDYQDFSDHSGRTRDLLRRQAPKKVPYGGYDPKARIQSAPAPLYPAPNQEPFNAAAAFDRIKRDSFARIDAAGALNNIVEIIRRFASSK